MEDWKDIIAERLRIREENRNNFEVLLNHVEKTISQLLNELSREYHIKTNLKTLKSEKQWLIEIEDESLIITPEIIHKYYVESKDIRTSLISIILDNFTFKFYV